MRKTLLIALISLVCPVLAMAQVNKEFSKTQRTSWTQLTEERLYTTPAVVQAVAKGVAPSYTMGAVVNIGQYPYVKDKNNKAVIMGYGGRNNINDNGCWNLCLNESGSLEITGWGGAAAVLSDEALPLNEYVHLMVAYDAPTMTSTVYVNGEVYGSKVWDLEQEWFTTEYPALYFASWMFGGKMDDIQIYNKSLNAEEVKLAMISPMAVDGLLALYTLDEIAEGTTGQFADQSGNNASNLICETVTIANQNLIWEGGCAYVIDDSPSWANYNGKPYGSCAESAPTLVESSRVVAPVEVTVTVADIENGSLVLKNGEEEVASGATIASGTELTLEAVPADGYKLVAVTANGEV
ncbi:MAG: LamG domain-containing protein, partial [Paramuribaculum sp.]|nr:LamG domain-containing protein [Paramuribaculum sp.]